MKGNVAFIKKLFGDSYHSLINKTSAWVQHRLVEYNVSDEEVIITSLYSVSSMRFGEPAPDNDLDVIVIYTGTMHEDSLFNTLGDDLQDYFFFEESNCRPNKIIVDFNPIKDGGLAYKAEKRSTFNKER